MKYYFYDSEGSVYLIYSVEPPIELGDRYIKTDKVFEEKEGYISRLKVVDGMLIAKYEKTKEQDLQEQINSLNIALAELMGL